MPLNNIQKANRYGIKVAAVNKGLDNTRIASRIVRIPFSKTIKI